MYMYIYTCIYIHIKTFFRLFCESLFRSSSQNSPFLDTFYIYDSQLRITCQSVSQFHKNCKSLFAS